MQQNNGAAPQGPTPEQVAAADAALARIRPIIQPSLHVMIRGLLMSCPGVPPHVVLCSIAYEAGNFMAQVFDGDIGQLAQIRGTIKQSFEEGMRKAPLVRPASNWSPPGSEPIKG